MHDIGIAAIVETFVGQITVAVEASAAQRIQDALAGAFGEPERRKPGRPPKQAAASVAPVATARPPAREKGKKVTPKVAQTRKLQGQYLGALKSLKGSDRAKVKTVAKEKGVAEAVKLALSFKKPRT